MVTFSLGNDNYLGHVLPGAARNAFRALFLNTLDLEVHMQPFPRCSVAVILSVSLATERCVLYLFEFPSSTKKMLGGPSDLLDSWNELGAHLTWKDPRAC